MPGMVKWIQLCTEFTFVSNANDNYSHDHMSWEKRSDQSAIIYMNYDCWLAFLAHDYQQMEVADTTPTRLTKEIHAHFRALQLPTTWPYPVGDHYHIPLETIDILIKLNSKRCDFLEHASWNHKQCSHRWTVKLYYVVCFLAWDNLIQLQPASFTF